jgi:hypothetical protein
MKHLSETQIGSTSTFRPSEAEKVILLNVDDMINQGRTVTQQDAINIPKQPDKVDIGKANLEAALTQLIKLGLLQYGQDNSIEITQTGMPVIDEIRKAEDQQELVQSDQEVEEPSNPDQPNFPFGFGEGFSLIRDLNDLSKLLG